MDKNKGFIRIPRKDSGYRAISERVKDYDPVVIARKREGSVDQASRCMDCGTPFCHDGCPIGNYIPEWNDFVFSNMWDKALALLDATNPMPEVTGRVCPAPCEYSCVLGINDDAITIRENELDIIEFGFKSGKIKPKPIAIKTGKKVAVVGSGPAGLSCAQRLNLLGHNVTVFERDTKIGGLLRYGIPDFKLEKRVLDRRIDIWEGEGIVFKPNVEVGRNYDCADLLNEFHAVCLAIGCRVPRDIDVAGRELKGIYFAMDYLSQVNKIVSGETVTRDIIDARGKKVVVIGGGDTGSDCVGSANRQGASSVTQIEIMPMPPTLRSKEYSWPKYPLLFKSSSSHEEGCRRMWSIVTKQFIGQDSGIKRILVAKGQLVKADQGSCSMIREIPGTDFEIEADMALISAGFVSCERTGVVDSLGVEMDQRGNVETGIDYMTSKKGVFCAGDTRRGQSLVVWAITEGLNCANHIDKYLMGESGIDSDKR